MTTPVSLRRRHQSPVVPHQPANTRPQVQAPKVETASHGSTSDGFEPSPKATRRETDGDAFAGASASASASASAAAAASASTGSDSASSSTSDLKPDARAGKLPKNGADRSVAWQKQVGPKGCYTAAAAMATKGGSKPAGKDDADNIWLANDSKTGDAKPGKPLAGNTDNTIVTDPAKVKLAKDYIDSQLDANKPVVVGVNHGAGPNNNLNKDGVTDHWVTITGRGADEKGQYYTFNDPGRGSKALGGDQNPNNRFYVDGDGKLYRPAPEKATGSRMGDYRYDLSAVRNNKD